ncbi:MAG: AIR synthase-related protein, partial [Candidatus Nanopelagicales bacterium]
IVGGDVARSSQLSVCVTALGDLQGRAPVTRAGAQVGDVVAVCGRLGFAAAGLAVLSRGFRSPRALVAAFQRPQPPYPAGIAAAKAGATAMCDVSDGLVADAGHIAHDSGVAIALQSSDFEVSEQLVAVAAAYGTDPMGWILSGGDDHALVATFAADVALPEGFTAIGKVVQLPVDAAAGETWISVDGRWATSEMGFSHFVGRAERS